MRNCGGHVVSYSPKVKFGSLIKRSKITSISSCIMRNVPYSASVYCVSSISIDLIRHNINRRLLVCAKENSVFAFCKTQIKQFNAIAGETYTVVGHRRLYGVLPSCRVI